MRHLMPLPELTISKSEHHELLLLAMTTSGLAGADLFYKLERMRIVADHRMVPEVVSLGSSVSYQSDTGEATKGTLLHPAQADSAAGDISVLTPLGTALLGLRAGHSTSWKARDGDTRILRVLSARNAGWRETVAALRARNAAAPGMAREAAERNRQRRSLLSPHIATV